MSRMPAAKITTKDLEKLSQAELLTMAQHVMDLKQAKKHQKLDDYLKSMHDGQLQFHKNKNRIRFIFAGNRCLREDQKIMTNSGPVAVGDLLPIDSVFSTNTKFFQHEEQIGIVPFPKGKANLYRVIHERGEFVASAQHRVFASKNDYQHVYQLRQNDFLPNVFETKVFFSHFLTMQEFDLLSWFLDAQSLKKKSSNYLNDYVAYIHQCDRQLLLGEEKFQDAFQASGDAHTSVHKACPLEHLQTDDFQAQKQLHSHLYLLNDQIYNLDETRLFEILYHQLRQNSLFLQDSQFYHKKLLNLVQSTSWNFLETKVFLQDLDLLVTKLFSLGSKIYKIEKLGQEEWFWDLTVTNNSNYIDEFGITHHNSGKTTAGTVEFLWAVLGVHPYQKYRLPLKTAIVSPDFENHTKNILEPKFKEWMPPNAIRKLDRHQNGAMKKIAWNTGSTTDVFSWDQDPMTFEGSDYDLVWFDEPPPHKIWKAMWRSCVDRGGRMFMTGTPLNCPWLYQVYQEIKDNKDPIRWYVKFNTILNAKNIGEGDEELGKKRLEEWASEYDEQEKASRLDGDFLQLQGLIFKNWDRKKHLLAPFPIPVNWDIIESIDPHPQKPWAVTWTAMAPNGAKILLQAMYCEGVLEQIADQIVLARSDLEIKDNLRPRISRTLIDNAASVPLWSKSNTDPTARRLSVREELENMIGPRGAGGPKVEVCPKNVQQKIEFLKSWLQPRDRNGIFRPDFYVFDNGKTDDFCFEIENYVWDRFRSRDREGFKAQPVKKDDDLLDSIMQVALTIGRRPVEEVQNYDLIGSLDSWGGSSSGRRSLVKRENDFY